MVNRVSHQVCPGRWTTGKYSTMDSPGDHNFVGTMDSMTPLVCSGVRLEG